MFQQQGRLVGIRERKEQNGFFRSGGLGVLTGLLCCVPNVTLPAFWLLSPSRSTASGRQAGLPLLSMDVCRMESQLLAELQVSQKHLARVFLLQGPVLWLISPERACI